MDEQRFDQLSRRVAAFATRRQALRAIAGAAVAAVVGTGRALAQDCAAPYNPCANDASCCAGAVCEFGLCMPGCRVAGAFINAGMSSPDNSCQVCAPEISTSSLIPANEGMSCWSGDPTAGVTTCQGGVCAGAGPVVCQPLTACHTAAINPQTGQCVQRFAEPGTPCGIGPMCQGGFYQPADECDGSGFCIGGGARAVSCAPYRCGDSACTASCASDADCDAAAHCDEGTCFPDEGLGGPCDEDSDCQSGICAAGVCCNQRCNGLCEVCSPETGGQCQPVVCDDGLSCTTGVCDERDGSCSHALNAGACLIGQICHPQGEMNPDNGCEVCDPSADVHGWTQVAAGTVCGQQDPICVEGVIFGSTAVCSANGVCSLETTSCLPYGCTEEMTCRTSCTSPDHCAGGALCVDDTVGIFAPFDVGVCMTSLSGELSASDLHSPSDEPVPYDMYMFVHGGGLLRISMIGTPGGGTLGYVGIVIGIIGDGSPDVPDFDTVAEEGPGEVTIEVNAPAGLYGLLASTSFDDPQYGTYTLEFEVL